MGHRQRKWARKAYDKLLLQLGGRCAICGSISDLSIDHVGGCNWKRNAVEWSYRVSIYRQEAAQGKLQVLCISCNSKKGAPDQGAPYTGEWEPDDRPLSEDGTDAPF